MSKSFAADPKSSRGRLFYENKSTKRSAFQRDRDRIIHSAAFRRLKHKSQVFVEHEGDHFRTRLTHSIEVGQIARSISAVLGLNVDLSESIALAHDLGHTPFGHTGEEALNDCMEPYGGFEHNAQALKVVTKIEKSYADFDGLNLSWESLEGIVKHNGPAKKSANYYLKEYNEIHNLNLDTFAGPEAQVAAIADDIAYNNHDLSDGLNAGLFEMEELLALPLISDCIQEVDKLYPGLEKKRRQHEALRRAFSSMVDDVITESRKFLEGFSEKEADDIRNFSHPVIRFSDNLLSDLQVIRQFLFERMYRHWTVRRMRLKVAKLTTNLFEIFMSEPQLLPPDWFKSIESLNDRTSTARTVADYIAGMTDRFALLEHRKLSDPHYLR